MNKKILLLVGGYIGGVIATLLYNKKNPSQIQDEISIAKKSGEKDTKIFFNNFVEVHKNLFNSLMDKYLTKENKDKMILNKDKFILLMDDFIKKAQNVFEEYKIKGKDYTEEGIERLEKFYVEKMSEIDDLKENFPEIIDNTKQKLMDNFEEFKSKMKK